MRELCRLAFIQVIYGPELQKEADTLRPSLSEGGGRNGSQAADS
jgi:hypothetical protein